MLGDMKGLARHYIQAMRSVQPKGPYFLGGMCAGTHIGEQMVLQLEAEGEPVADASSLRQRHDVRVARTLRFDAGTVVVMDRGYVDYAWFGQLTAQAVFFVRIAMLLFGGRPSEPRYAAIRRT